LTVVARRSHSFLLTHKCATDEQASGEARFITGTEIVVDGGMTARCD